MTHIWEQFRVLFAAGLIYLMFVMPILAGGVDATQQFDITGIYSVVGKNPDNGEDYTGEVRIVRLNDLYRVQWKVGGGYEGTGILNENVFSVAYTDSGKKWFGIVTYEIMEDGRKLVGRWVAHGGIKTGSEVLVRQHIQKPAPKKKENDSDFMTI